MIEQDIEREPFACHRVRTLAAYWGYNNRVDIPHKVFSFRNTCSIS